MSATLFVSGDPEDEDRDLTTEEWKALLEREDAVVDLQFEFEWVPGEGLYG